jgi:hypothetical protein
MRGLVSMAEPTLMLYPLADWRSPSWQHQPFDAAVCRAGVKEFVRPVSPSDVAPLPAGVGFAGDWVLVREITPGVRARLDVTLAFHDAMAPLIDPVPVEVEVKIGRTWGG